MNPEEHNRRVDLNSVMEIWGVWDYERVETHDSEEPRLVAVCVGAAFKERPAQTATRVSAVLNAQPHPNATMGYSYNYRAEPVGVPRAFSDWTDEDILRIIDAGERA